MKSKAFLPGAVMLLTQALSLQGKEMRQSLFSTEKFKHALLFIPSLLNSCVDTVTGE